MAASTDKQDTGYLAQPPGPCCEVGTLHTGDPTGTMEDILDVPTYVARPNPATANGHIVLYFPDVWGMSVNSKLIMDAFAQAGYLTLGMDYFRGDPITKYIKAKGDPAPEGFDRAAWRHKHFSFATENVPKWAAAVREKFSDGDKTKVACTGYCFGAPFVCHLLAGDLVSAGAVAHPTQLKEDHLLATKKPILLSCAENDNAFPTEKRRLAVDILREQKTPYHVQLFHGVGHGFAVKCDLTDPYQRWCKEQSVRAMVDWFDYWLVKA